MKLKNLYDSIIKYGQKKDPRGMKKISQQMARIKAKYKKCSEGEKRTFDKEKLTNPYADTRILNGDPNTDVKTILIGIDIEVGEIVLADRLKEKGVSIDLVLSHHPEGKAHAGFFNVMYMQADILNKYGVPINVAEGILEDRIKEVERKVMPANHNRTVDAAKLLGIPLMCAHTPADNCVATYLQDLLDKKNPETLKDVIKVIEQIPEYEKEMEKSIRPKILVGKETGRTGKIFVDMTGGTEGSEKMFEALVHAGIGTIVGMHLSDKHIKEAKKNNVNVIIAGHISSDNLGINLLLDELQKKEKIKIICCSGFDRVTRKSKR